MARREVQTIDALRQILDQYPDRVFVRWSRGPAMDRRRGVSRDYLNGGVHAGLSAVRVERDWLERPQYLARRLREYGFLRIKDGQIRPWLMVGELVGRDSDGYDSIRIAGDCYPLALSLCEVAND